MPAYLAAQNCTNNLLTNSGFENGFQDWGILHVAELTTDANAGNQAVRIEAGVNRIYQALVAQPGTTYTLSAQVKTDPIGGYGTIGIKFLSSSWQPLDELLSSLLLPSGYEMIGGLELTAPPNTAYIEVSIYSSTNDLLVDDVCLTEGGGGNLYEPRSSRAAGYYFSQQQRGADFYGGFKKHRAGKWVFEQFLCLPLR